MRPNQQSNKSRQRGRNNGGRKHVNPLSRSYESNGPDVKVRGNAAHVAEKYVQLARDAQASGDSVMAENYLQHAEHYFRIVSAAQAQNMPRSDQLAGQSPESEDEDDDFPPINDRFSLPEPPRQQQPQQQQTQPEAQSPARESADGAPAEAVAGEGEGQMQADGSEMPRRHRDRRGRRRSRGAAGEQGNADPAGAPQPDVGELPAFLTAGGSSAAE